MKNNLTQKEFLKIKDKDSLLEVLKNYSINSSCKNKKIYIYDSNPEKLPIWASIFEINQNNIQNQFISSEDEIIKIKSMLNIFLKYKCTFEDLIGLNGNVVSFLSATLLIHPEIFNYAINNLNMGKKINSSTKKMFLNRFFENIFDEDDESLKAFAKAFNLINEKIPFTLKDFKYYINKNNLYGKRAMFFFEKFNLSQEMCQKIYNEMAKPNPKEINSLNFFTSSENIKNNFFYGQKAGLFLKNKITPALTKEDLFLKISNNPFFLGLLSEIEFKDLDSGKNPALWLYINTFDFNVNKQNLSFLFLLSGFLTSKNLKKEIESSENSIFIKTILTLVNKGADPALIGENGLTAYEYAKKIETLDIYNFNNRISIFGGSNANMKVFSEEELEILKSLTEHALLNETLKASPKNNKTSKNRI